MYREHTKVIKIGNKKIGGGNPVLIQSMTNTRTDDVEATVKQILELEAAGCEIIRCAVPDMAAAEALSEIKKQIHKQFGSHPLQNPDYGRIINEKHFDRICGLIDPEKLVCGGKTDRRRPRGARGVPALNGYL